MVPKITTRCKRETSHKRRPRWPYYYLRLGTVRNILEWIALEKAVGTTALKHQSPAIWCDNIVAVSWVHKFRSNTSPLAGNILQAFATRLHTCETSLVAVDHLAGLFNIMANIASRKHRTDDFEFLKSFNSSFPPPQGNSWKMCRLSTKIASNICSQLLMKTSKMGPRRRLGKKECVFSELGSNALVDISQEY